MNSEMRLWAPARLLRIAAPNPELGPTANMCVWTLVRTHARRRVAIRTLRGRAHSAAVCCRWALWNARSLHQQHRCEWLWVRSHHFSLSTWSWAAAHLCLRRTGAKSVQWAPELAVKTRARVRVRAHSADEILAHRRRARCALEASLAAPLAISALLTAPTCVKAIRRSGGSRKWVALRQGAAPAATRELLDAREDLVSA